MKPQVENDWLKELDQLRSEKARLIRWRSLDRSIFFIGGFGSGLLAAIGIGLVIWIA
jgi:hypothetical protein